MRIIFFAVIVLSLLLNSCGGDNPSFSKVEVISQARGVLLETTDSDVLDEIHSLFYNKKEVNGVGPDFKYLIDITDSTGTVRWQYSDEGFVRNYELKSAIIYEISSVMAFNKALKVK